MYGMHLEELAGEGIRMVNNFKTVAPLTKLVEAWTSTPQNYQDSTEILKRLSDRYTTTPTVDLGISLNKIKIDPPSSNMEKLGFHGLVQDKSLLQQKLKEVLKHWLETGELKGEIIPIVIGGLLNTLKKEG